MGTTITAGAAVISPAAVEGYETSRAGGSIVHEIIGRSVPDVTLHPAGTRRGTLGLFFESEAPARVALDALAGATTAQLVATAADIGMTFVVPEGQDLTLTLDAGLGHWRLAVPYREVAP